MAAAQDIAPPPSFARTVVRAALLGAAYWAAVVLAGAISIPNVSIAPIRLPNAIAIVALLLTPPSTWWVYLLAIVPRNTSFTNAAAGFFHDPSISLLYLTANSLEIVATALVMRRVGRGSPRLDGLADCL